jgi:hypothetical protein
MSTELAGLKAAETFGKSEAAIMRVALKTTIL